MSEPYSQQIPNFNKMSQDDKEKAIRIEMIKEGIIVPAPENPRPEKKEQIKVVPTGE